MDCVILDDGGFLLMSNRDEYTHQVCIFLSTVIKTQQEDVLQSKNSIYFSAHPNTDFFFSKCIYSAHQSFKVLFSNWNTLQGKKKNYKEFQLFC